MVTNGEQKVTLVVAMKLARITNISNLTIKVLATTRTVSVTNEKKSHNIMKLHTNRTES